MSKGQHTHAQQPFYGPLSGTIRVSLYQKKHVTCKGQRDKERRTAESSPLTVHSKACAVGGTQKAATDDTIPWPPGGDRLRRWENQRMLSSSSNKIEFCCRIIVLRVSFQVSRVRFGEG